jgi:hypothetical protein
VNILGFRQKGLPQDVLEVHIVEQNVTNRLLFVLGQTCRPAGREQRIRAAPAADIETSIIQIPEECSLLFRSCLMFAFHKAASTSNRMGNEVAWKLKR